MIRRWMIVVIAASVVLTACQTSKTAQLVTPSQKGAVELRAMQSRMFDTTDRAKTIRTVIATLQDMGYSIEKVEAEAGTVSARKLSALQLTVSVFPRNDRRMTVRANAVVRTESAASQVDAPEFYQKLFFEPLSKSLFLAANQDSGEEPAQAMPPMTTPDAAKPDAAKPAESQPAPAAPKEGDGK